MAEDRQNTSGPVGYKALGWAASKAPDAVAERIVKVADKLYPLDYDVPQPSKLELSNDPYDQDGSW